MKKRSLFQIILIIFLSSILLTIGTISVFSIKTLSDFTYAEVENTLYNQGQIIFNLLPQMNKVGETATQSFVKDISRDIKSRITLISLDGVVIADSHENSDNMENHIDRPEVIEAIKGNRGRSKRLSATLSEKMLYITIPPDQEKIIVRMALSVDYIGVKIIQTYKNIIIFSLIILLITILISIFTAKSFSQVISEIKDISEFYAKGDFTKKLKMTGPIEISQLKQSINSMGDQLFKVLKKTIYQKNELQAMLNTMVEAVILLDRKLKIKEMNPAAETLLNRKLSECRRKRISEIIDNKEILLLLEKSIKNSKIGESTIHFDKGIIQYLQVHSSPLSTLEEKPKGILLVMNNISRIKQLENMRKDFVSNVSHELKTPVTLINGYVETLLDGVIGDKDKMDEFLKVIQTHSYRINHIIDDLLSLSHIENIGSNLEMDDFLLYDLLFSAYTSTIEMAKAEEISMEVICFDKLNIHGNPRLMEQAVFNLINNAIKYSGKGSKVIISGKMVQKNGRKTVEITVEDNGAGMAADQLDRIFERFYRIGKKQNNAIGGTGLGLSIVRHIILAHQGEISVKSTINEGSQFYLSFPII